jgi:hypothetical protein
MDERNVVSYFLTAKPFYGQFAGLDPCSQILHCFQFQLEQEGAIAAGLESSKSAKQNKYDGDVVSYCFLLVVMLFALRSAARSCRNTSRKLKVSKSKTHTSRLLLFPT